MADLDEVAALLHVHEKAHAGGHSNIAGAALARLRQINSEHISFGPKPEPIPEGDQSEPSDTDPETDPDEDPPEEAA